jgi:hypothetical protein
LAIRSRVPVKFLESQGECKKPSQRHFVFFVDALQLGLEIKSSCLGEFNELIYIDFIEWSEWDAPV